MCIDGICFRFIFVVFGFIPYSLVMSGMMIGGLFIRRMCRPRCLYGVFPGVYSML